MSTHNGVLNWIALDLLVVGTSVLNWITLDLLVVGTSVLNWIEYSWVPMCLKLD